MRLISPLETREKSNILEILPSFSVAKSDKISSCGLQGREKYRHRDTCKWQKILAIDVDVPDVRVIWLCFLPSSFYIGGQPKTFLREKTEGSIMIVYNILNSHCIMESLVYKRLINVYCGSSHLLIILASLSRLKRKRPRLAYHSVHRRHPRPEITGSSSYCLSSLGLFLPVNVWMQI